MKTKTSLLALAGVTAVLTTTAAHAHVGINSPAVANLTNEITFTLGHGCPGDVDTYRVKIDIPAGITNVRPLSSDFGPATVEKTGSNVTSVTWLKTAPVADGDPNFYKLTLRLKTPDAPFTKIYFPIHQSCMTPAGVESSNEWVGTPTLPDGGSTAPEPSPVLLVLPPRVPGWNKYPVPVAVKDMTVFKDALIVWQGNAAYSANPNTAAQLAKEAGVTKLAEIAAGTEIWVKY